MARATDLMLEVRDVLEYLTTSCEADIAEIQSLLNFKSRFIDTWFTNCVLLWTQMPHATYVADQATWRSVGRDIIGLGLDYLKPWHIDSLSAGVSVNLKGALVWDISQTYQIEGGPVDVGLKREAMGDTALYTLARDFLDAMNMPPFVRHIDRWEGRVVRIHEPEMLLRRAASILLRQLSVGISEEKVEMESEAVAYIVCRSHGVTPNHLEGRSIFRQRVSDMLRSLMRADLVCNIIANGLQHLEIYDMKIPA